MNQENNEQHFNLLEMQQALSLYVWKNGSARDEIIKNPKATIERELGVKFDDHIKINIVNHTDPNQVTFILPYDIHKAVGQDLDESQLEAIAGGFSFSSFKNIAKDLLGGVDLGELGSELGDRAGDGLISLGKKVGVNLPTLNLGKKLGGNAGKLANRLLE